MTKREKVISDLEQCLDDSVAAVVPADTVIEAIALLKAQEPIEARLHLCDSCTKLYPECDATADGIEFGCGFGNDNIIGCTAYENRWKAQEPVEPTIGGDADGPCGNWWYQCGKCKEAMDYHDRYCRNCGQAVKWDG
jgi:hypothetical protein